VADARLLNQPVPFEFQGKTYRVTPEPTFQIEAAYQLFLEREAYLAVHRHKGTLDPGDYEAQLKGWRHDLAAKEYAWGSEVCFRALRSEPGWRELAYLLMRHAEAQGGQPEPVTRDLVERIAKDPEKARELLAVVWGVKDPNPPGPGATPPAAP
jgi:hypothetical protein